MKNGQSSQESQVAEVFTRAADPVLRLFLEVLRDEISLSLKEAIESQRTDLGTTDTPQPENIYQVMVSLTEIEKEVLIEATYSGNDKVGQIVSAFKGTDAHPPLIKTALTQLKMLGLVDYQELWSEAPIRVTAVGGQVAECLP